MSKARASRKVWIGAAIALVVGTWYVRKDDDAKDTTTPPVAPPPVELPQTAPEQAQAEDRQADKNNG